jgi:hypothetical protein
MTHLSIVGSKLAQTSPAALPLGMFGSGDDIEGAMQQAPQLGLHFKGLSLL